MKNLKEHKVDEVKYYEGKDKKDFKANTGKYKKTEEKNSDIDSDGFELVDSHKKKKPQKEYENTNYRGGYKKKYNGRGGYNKGDREDRGGKGDKGDKEKKPFRPIERKFNDEMPLNQIGTKGDINDSEKETVTNDKKEVQVPVAVPAKVEEKSNENKKKGLSGLFA